MDLLVILQLLDQRLHLSIPTIIVCTLLPRQPTSPFLARCTASSTASSTAASTASSTAASSTASSTGGGRRLGLLFFLGQWICVQMRTFFDTSSFRTPPNPIDIHGYVRGNDTIRVFATDLLLKQQPPPIVDLYAVLACERLVFDKGFDITFSVRRVLNAQVWMPTT